MPLITGKQIADGSITNSKLSGKFSAQTPRVVDKDLTTAPGSTVVGDIYILAGVGGTWSGGAVNDLAEALDTTGTLWNFVTPTEGFVAWVLDEDAEYRFNGTVWQIEVVIGGGAPTAGITLELSSTSPVLRLNETGADADEKLWQLLTDLGGLSLQTVNDADSVDETAITITRAGTVVGSISFGANSELVIGVNQADHTERVLGVTNAGTDGATFEVFTGDISPIGVVTGSPGDLYVLSRAAVGTDSTIYQHKGASANDTDWFIIGPSLIQTNFTDLAVNATTTAASFAAPSTLLTTTITKLAPASKLIVHFSVGTSNTNNGRQMFFRVVVDGVAQRAVGVDCPNSGLPQSASIVTSVIGVGVGSRTILIEWYVSANTGQVRPVAAPDAEHASMLVEEILA